MESLGFLELIDSMSSAPPESSEPIAAGQNRRTDRRESWMRRLTPSPPPPFKRHRNDQMENFDQGGRNSYQDEDMDGNWGGNNSRNERGWNTGRGRSTDRGRQQNNHDRSNRGWKQNRHNDGNLLSSPSDYSEPSYSGKDRSRYDNQSDGTLSWRNNDPSTTSFDDYSQPNNYQASRSRGRNQPNNYPVSKGRGRSQNNLNMSHSSGNQNVHQQQNKRDQSPSTPDDSDPGCFGGGESGGTSPVNTTTRVQGQDINRRRNKGREEYNEIYQPTENLGRFGNRNYDVNRFENEEYIPPTEPLTKPDWSKQDVVPIEKNIYVPSSIVMGRSADEVEVYRRAHQLYVGGSDIHNPIQEFNEYNFPHYIMNQINKEGLTRPTTIQSQIWPIALSGKNIACIDEAGIGKILSYMVPALIHINHQPRLVRGDGPIVIILAAMESIVQQIYQVSLPYINNYRLNCARVCREVPMEQQMDDLLRGAEIVIATPDCLVKILETRQINLARTSCIVLNDADYILWQGFEKQLQTIFDQSRPERQTMMFTKSWSNGIHRLAKHFFGEYIRVYLKPKMSKEKKMVQQTVEVVEENDKGPRLIKLLQSIATDCPQYKAILLLRRTEKVLQMIKLLNGAAFNTVHLDEEKSQDERMKTLQEFHFSIFRIMVGTNAAFKGFSIENVTHVIHVDFPHSLDTYNQWIRIAEKVELKGYIFSFFTRRFSHFAGELVTKLKESYQIIDPKLEEMALILETSVNQNQGNKQRNNRRRPISRVDSGFEVAHFDAWDKLKEEQRGNKQKNNRRRPNSEVDSGSEVAHFDAWDKLKEEQRGHKAQDNEEKSPNKNSQRHNRRNAQRGRQNRSSLSNSYNTIGGAVEVFKSERTFGIPYQSDVDT